MMFADCTNPLTEKQGQRLNSFGTLSWMRRQDFPLVLRWSTRLVEDFSGHRQLTDVVQHCTPSQAVSISVAQF
jgi:hypothetical protein